MILLHVNHRPCPSQNNKYVLFIVQFKNTSWFYFYVFSLNFKKCGVFRWRMKGTWAARHMNTAVLKASEALLYSPETLTAPAVDSWLEEHPSSWQSPERTGEDFLTDWAEEGRRRLLKEERCSIHTHTHLQDSDTTAYVCEGGGLLCLIPCWMLSLYCRLLGEGGRSFWT